MIGWKKMRRAKCRGSGRLQLMSRWIWLPTIANW